MPTAVETLWLEVAVTYEETSGPLWAHRNNGAGRSPPHSEGGSFFQTPRASVRGKTHVLLLLLQWEWRVILCGPSLTRARERLVEGTALTKSGWKRGAPASS